MPEFVNNEAGSQLSKKNTQPSLEVKPGNWYQQPATKRSWWWRIAIGVFAILLVIGLGVLTKAVLAINSTNSISGDKVGFFDQIKHLISNPDKQLVGEADERVNVLLVGIGGAGHQGAYLADTIILASIKPSTEEVATLSIPRDLYVEIPEYGWRKINNAMAFGEMGDYLGGGPALLIDALEPVIGVPIHYYARVDFEGFRKIIDDLGGIDVYVENGFTDYEYPDYNYGYQTISFTEGWEHMNGERALQYSRSRHGTNGEGSDFARSRRQQKVLFAAKEKALSLNTLLNPNKIVNILESLGEHNQTNMEIWEILRLADLIKNIEREKVISKVLENSPEGLLQSETTLDGAYILRPRTGDYTAIQDMAENIFEVNHVTQENAQLIIQNSTNVEGLASDTADMLSARGYAITTVTNANTEEPLDRTTIYDLSNGNKPYTIVALQKLLDVTVMTQPPDFYQTALSNTNSGTTQIADILVVLGADYSSIPLLTNAN